ncbi:MAG: hypothetical protein K0R02_563 [Rickettsiaceae bacterium]|jgi:steroid delta-isomerase-like uncharacterized protein|nr:hypothetical protein [Rickettsiaceae bacterium]
MNNNNSIKSIIDRYIQSYNSFNVKDMVELFTEDCAFENISNPGEVMLTFGREGLENLANHAKEYFASRKQEITNYIISDDQACIEIKYTAIIAKDFNGMSKGSILNLRGVSIFKFKDGKILHLKDYS